MDAQDPWAKRRRATVIRIRNETVVLIDKIEIMFTMPDAKEQRTEHRT